MFASTFRISTRFLWVACLLATGVVFSSNRSAYGQAGLRESLELLDRDHDGQIEPHEITPLSRPYLERIAKTRRLSLDRPNRIDKLQEAARIYYAQQNGVAGDRVRVDDDRSVRSFRPDDDDEMVPEFGLPIIKHRYTKDDLDEAEEIIERYDRDKDGYLDRREVRRVRWTHRDPFEMDLDNDDRLSRLELAQRYARRRSLRDDSSELIQRAQRTGNGIRPTVSKGDLERQQRQERSEWLRKGGNRFWLTASMMSRFDSNRNGRLESEETLDLGLPVGQIDADQNSEISRDELFAFLTRLQDQTGGAVEGLPGWFYERDENRDGQIALPEFADELTDRLVEQFLALDSNGDGLLTATEVLSSQSMMGGRFENNDAEIIPPKKTIVSEIEIEEDFLIADLNLQLSITHSSTAQLDAYLTGPEGQRIELFTGVGGSDNHFDGTIFDDQADERINKARPPFEGSFQPEGLIKRQPGLSVFNGKTIQGIWQLTIRGSRSDRFGMLHRWSLIARPDEEGLISTADDEDIASSIDPSDLMELDLDSDGANALSSPALSTPTLPASMFASAKPDRPTPSAENFWTPERKAEMTRRLRKPSPEIWDQMDENAKRQFMEDRKRAITEYKQALGGRRGETSQE